MVRVFAGDVQDLVSRHGILESEWNAVVGMSSDVGV
jgi:hypothetical protein